MTIHDKMPNEPRVELNQLSLYTARYSAKYFLRCSKLTGFKYSKDLLLLKLFTSFSPCQTRLYFRHVRALFESKLISKKLFKAFIAKLSKKEIFAGIKARENLCFLLAGLEPTAYIILVANYLFSIL